MIENVFTFRGVNGPMACSSAKALVLAHVTRVKKGIVAPLKFPISVFLCEWQCRGQQHDRVNTVRRHRLLLLAQQHCETQMSPFADWKKILLNQALVRNQLFRFVEDLGAIKVFNVFEVVWVHFTLHLEYRRVNEWSFHQGIHFESRSSLKWK